MVSRRRALVWLGASTLSVAGSGCALFTHSWDSVAGASRNATSELRLKPILKPRDAVELDIMFVERPVGDSLLGEALWREVDQIGPLGVEKRDLLRAHGIRVGVASSNPPRALQTMLGAGDSLASGPVNKTRSYARSGHRQHLLPDGEQEIQASPLFANCSVLVPGITGTSIREYQNCRFMFRLKAQRQEEGWATLEFTPEIHHGEFRWRPTPGEMGWEGRTTQEIVALHNERFEVTLNVGEMVIITSEGDGPKSLGRHFFRSVDPEGTVQHVLLIRLAGISQIEPVRVE